MEKYSPLELLRMERMPHWWCPGCGHGLVLRGVAQAISGLNLNQDHIAIFGGIGCSGRTPFLVNVDAMHTTHGRALAFATGMKLVKPELTIIVAMGDGDSVGIGGNHFIHAARRNIDLTAVIFNNSIYGMTGGQVAPTTQAGTHTTTTMAGSIENPFDVVELALGAGAGYVARTTTFDYDQMVKFLTTAINYKGFSVQCPTYLGRLNSLKEPYEMIHYYKDVSVSLDSGEADFKPRLDFSLWGGEAPNQDLTGKMKLGEFRCEERPEFVRCYWQMSQDLAAQREAKNG